MTNREDWLQRAALAVAPLFDALDAPLPPVRVSVGFAGGSKKKSTTIGQCWSSIASSDKACHIFIHPGLVDPVDVLQTLIHELVHAVDDCASGHKGAFRKLARKLGLEGRLTATHAGEALREVLVPIIETLGEYPHAKLLVSSGLVGEPKQTTRMLKLVAPCCGYVIRTTRKWLDDEGLPQCPHGLEFEEAGA